MSKEIMKRTISEVECPGIYMGRTLNAKNPGLPDRS